MKDPMSADRDGSVGHNLLLAHAHTVALYRKKYQPQQGGKISIVNVSMVL
jgi:hypothetical protein